MRHSESFAQLAVALVAAQGEMSAVAKDALNPHFKSRYASLDVIVETIRPILAAHSLGVMQGASSEDGKVLTVETMLLHKSGEWVASDVVVPMAKIDPQGAGGALTYGRRYGLSALLNIVSDEDDDGNAASRPSFSQRNQSGAKNGAGVKSATTVESGSAPGHPAGALPGKQPAPASPASEAKADEDKKWKSKTLGERSDKELREIMESVKDNGLLVELHDSCRRILAKRNPDAKLTKAFAEEHAEQDAAFSFK